MLISSRHTTDYGPVPALGPARPIDGSGPPEEEGVTKIVSSPIESEPSPPAPAPPPAGVQRYGLAIASSDSLCQTKMPLWM